jgi:signal transduction histidine kinase
MSIDNKMIPFAITVTLMTVIFVFGMIVFLITFQKRQNRKSREYLQSLVAEKDRTMSLISLEVHDNINQVLNATRLNVHWLNNSALPEQKEHIEKIGRMLDKLIMDTNNISHTLNTGYLKQKGLIQSLKEESEWVTNSRDMGCDVHISGITERFEGQIELMLFRIAQEAVNNAIKHAAAKHIRISVVYDRPVFVMTIADDGKGFDTNVPDIMKGVGLSSMLSRAKIVQGFLNIESRIGEGTTVTMVVPRSALKVTDTASVVENMQDKEITGENYAKAMIFPSR